MNKRWKQREDATAAPHSCDGLPLSCQDNLVYDAFHALLPSDYSPRKEVAHPKVRVVTKAAPHPDSNVGCLLSLG